MAVLFLLQFQMHPVAGGRANEGSCPVQILGLILQVLLVLTEISARGSGLLHHPPPKCKLIGSTRSSILWRETGHVLLMFALLADASDKKHSCFPEAFSREQLTAMYQVSGRQMACFLPPISSADVQLPARY